MIVYLGSTLPTQHAIVANEGEVGIPNLNRCNHSVLAAAVNARRIWKHVDKEPFVANVCQHSRSWKKRERRWIFTSHFCINWQADISIMPLDYLQNSVMKCLLLVKKSHQLGPMVDWLLSYNWSDGLMPQRFEAMQQKQIAADAFALASLATRSVWVMMLLLSMLFF